MTPHNVPAQPQPLWFLLLFALAVAGGSIAYVPLLTALLPLKVSEILGSADVPALAQVTFYGAVMASLSNIAFGMLSDRTRTRVPWIVTGLIASSVMLIAIGRASTLAELMILIMAWQIGLNMMLGPLIAWAGDCVPDSQKGLLGGLLAAAPAMGAVAGSLVTFEAAVDPAHRFPAIVAMVAALVTPVLLIGRGRERLALMQPVSSEELERTQSGSARAIVIKMWLARFLVQISEAGLFAFLLFWLRSITPDFHENASANIFSAVLIVTVPLSLIIGRWSDRQNRPILPLSSAAALAAVGLLVMAAAQTIPIAVAGYVLFGIGASIFLALHTSQTLRVLPKPQHRGRDLGIFNLTNTVPSLVMPWLTLTLVPAFGFSALFILFAVLAALAAGLLATALRPS